MSERVTKQDLRKGAFKKAIDRDEARRAREEASVGIRRAKREETLMKKRRARMTGGSSFGSGVDYGGASDQTESNLGSRTPDASLHSRLPEMVEGVFSSKVADQVRYTLEFRRLLSIERNPPIEEVIQLGVVPRFVSLLQNDAQPQLQFEAAWSLTNIASGTSSHTGVVVHEGAIPVFVHLLSSPNDDVREQAVWALGNIAGDSAQCRDLVLAAGALPPLLLQLTSNSTMSMLRNAVWTLSNLCRGRPAPAFETVKPALAILVHLLYMEDSELLTDACWALSYLSDGSSEKIMAVVESGVVRRVVELLMHQSVSVQTPALRTVGSIVTGCDIQTQFVINVGALNCLLTLLNSPKKIIRKEACWTVSNITAGNKDQIQGVIEANIFPPLVQILTNADFEIKKEAAWAISNATSGGSTSQIKYLVQQGCITPLCNLLSVHDVRVVTVALEGLENILRVGEKEKETAGAERNEFADMIEAADGLDKIEHLQSSSQQEIYDKAVKLLEIYFGADREEDIEGVAPPQVSGSQFSFGGEAHAAPDGGFDFAAGDQSFTDSNPNGGNPPGWGQ